METRKKITRSSEEEKSALSESQQSELLDNFEENIEPEFYEEIKHAFKKGILNVSLLATIGALHSEYTRYFDIPPRNDAVDFTIAMLYLISIPSTMYSILHPFTKQFIEKEMGYNTTEAKYLSMGTWITIFGLLSPLSPQMTAGAVVIGTGMNLASDALIKVGEKGLSQLSSLIKHSLFKNEKKEEAVEDRLSANYASPQPK